MVADFLADSQTEKLFAGASILNRVGQPSHISEAVLLLLSDKFSYTTGSELLVDGGVIAKSSLVRTLGSHTLLHSKLSQIGLESLL